MQSHTRRWNISFKTFSAGLFLLLAPGVFVAQTPSKDQSPQTTASGVAAPQQTPTATPGASDQGPATVYGVQGVLIETLDGKMVSAQAVDQLFNPASSAKLATALVAL